MKTLFIAASLVVIGTVYFFAYHGKQTLSSPQSAIEARHITVTASPTQTPHLSPAEKQLRKMGLTADPNGSVKLTVSDPSVEK